MDFLSNVSTFDEEGSRHGYENFDSELQHTMENAKIANAELQQTILAEKLEVRQ